MAFLKKSTFVLAALLTNGCSHVSYLWQASIGQLSLYNHERPIEEVIKDPRTKSEVRERLTWIPEIKKFVEDSLGVKATGNYTTYVDLKRSNVVWALTSAPPFSVEAKEWSFPIAGSFPYLGFFSEEKARDWEKREREQGNDTHVRGVSAYSTLGYFRDPLLSSMLSRHKQDLVNLIFHETTHGQIYIKGQGSFNEQAASYVGDYGEREWIETTYGKENEKLAEWSQERASRRKLALLLRGFADDLKQFYASTEGQPIEQRQAGKENRFESFRSKLGEDPHLKGYTKLFTNNAALAAYLTYEDDQEVFDLLHEKCGGSVKRSLRCMKRFEKDNKFKSGEKLQTMLREQLETGRLVCLDL